MRLGKLSEKELEKCLGAISKKRSEVLVHGGVGEDCALIKCDDLIAVTTDPITAKCDNPGSLAVRVSANDIFASGGEPFACTLTVIAPKTQTAEGIYRVISDAENSAMELNLDIIGGHSEFSDAVNRMLVSVTMLGRVVKFISTGGAKAGDKIILTKYAALEGTAILASEHKNLLSAAERAEIDKECVVCVAKEARILRNLDISSMHDVTEGGVIGAVCETAAASKLGARLYLDDVPLLNVTLSLTDKLNINPYRLISSGSMIVTAADGNAVVSALQDGGVKATIIGEITDSGETIAISCEREERVSVRADELFNVNRGK